jgi:hypothetical protein
MQQDTVGMSDTVTASPSDKDHLRILSASLKESIRYFLKLTIFVVVVTSVVYYLQKAGVFRKLPFGVGILKLPDELNVVLYAYMGNTYAGMGIMGELVRNGMLPTSTAIELLAFCMLCSRPIVTLIEAPSYYFGFFGFLNGLLIMLMTLSIFTILTTTFLIGMYVFA